MRQKTYTEWDKGKAFETFALDQLGHRCFIQKKDKSFKYWDSNPRGMSPVEFKSTTISAMLALLKHSGFAPSLMRLPPPPPFLIDIHVLHPRKLKMEWMKLNFPSTQSVTYTCFTPRKLKTEWMKLNFPSTSKCHLYMFYTPKTRNGVDETQLPSSSKCH